jgi:glycine/D-amino acid oxidase-like deaminating enzyme
VAIQTDTAATVSEDGVQTDEKTVDSDAVLVAAGAGTPGALSGLDDDIALGHYRTQAVAAGPVEEDVPIYYDASTERYARPTAGGLLAGDGSELYYGDPAAADRTADEEFRTDRLAGLGHRLREEVTLQRSWAGLCTATPDRDPLLGELEPGVFVATGMCGHGLMRSPALGRTVADQILGAEPISGFDPTRFDGDESIALPVGVTD